MNSIGKKIFSAALIASVLAGSVVHSSAGSVTKSLSSDIYDLVNESIVIVERNTTTANFMKDIRVKSGFSAKVYLNGAETTGTVMCTNMSLVCLDSGSAVTETYGVAVVGDATGDAASDVFDLLAIKKSILNLSSLSDTAKVAADLKRDKTVNALDLLFMKRVILNMQTLPNAANTKEAVSMYTSSVANEGQAGRIAAAMKKADAGQPINIGFIGGSVTYGNEKSYAVKVADWWKAKYPGLVTAYNAGISGTSSVFGVGRVERDLISKNCDFVIVEFAVNDYDSLCPQAYEALMRRILKSDSKPGVMSLFMSYYQNGGFSNVQHDQLPTAQYYNIPAVSYMDALKYRKANEPGFDPAPLFKDSVHQNEAGDAMAADLVNHQLEKIYQKRNMLVIDSFELPAPRAEKASLLENALLFGTTNITPKSKSGFTVKNSSSWDIWQTQWNNPVAFPQAWDGKAGDVIEFEIDAALAYFVYHTKNMPSTGVTFYVDDNFFFIPENTYDGYKFKLFQNATTSSKHTLKIVVDASFTGTFMLDGFIAAK